MLELLSSFKSKLKTKLFSSAYPTQDVSALSEHFWICASGAVTIIVLDYNYNCSQLAVTLEAMIAFLVKI